MLCQTLIFSTLTINKLQVYRGREIAKKASEEGGRRKSEIEQNEQRCKEGQGLH